MRFSWKEWFVWSEVRKGHRQICQMREAMMPVKDLTPGRTLNDCLIVMICLLKCRCSSCQGLRNRRSSGGIDLLRMPIIDLNETEERRWNDDDRVAASQRTCKQVKRCPSPMSMENEKNSASDDEELGSKRPNFLSEHARRLLILGTIRPSKSFYKDLSEVDVEYLMEYFRRMRKTNRKITSEQINEDLQSKFKEYKPKICKLKLNEYGGEVVCLVFQFSIRLVSRRIKWRKSRRCSKNTPTKSELIEQNWWNWINQFDLSFETCPMRVHWQQCQSNTTIVF